MLHQDIAALIPDLLATGGVGLFERDPSAGTVRGDIVFASLFGLTAVEAEAGVPLSRVEAAVHPAERYLFRHKQADVDPRGGLVIVEYRTIPSPGVTKWVLVRGHYGPRGDFAISPGRGVVIDVTASHAKSNDKPYLVVDNSETTSPLELAADHAVKLHTILEGLGANCNTDLGAAADILLILLGRALARSGGAVRASAT